jgi:large subunit ribosomal protein L4
MLEVHHYTASAQKKGSYALPEDYDGTVNMAVLYQAVRAFRNNQRQGTASTKTRAEVAGGGRKPWRQKGTGRARAGTNRSPIWKGGGVVFGPRPRSYHTNLPRKVRQLARRSALNARANEGAIHVIEALEFEAPKTRQMVELLGKLELAQAKVLILTKESRPEVLLSCRNLQNIRVMRYADASAYDILWSSALLVEEEAIGGHTVEAKKTPTKRAKRVAKATTRASKAAKKAKTVKRASKTAKKKASKTATGVKKGGSDA